MIQIYQRIVSFSRNIPQEYVWEEKNMTDYLSQCHVEPLYVTEMHSL